MTSYGVELRILERVTPGGVRRVTWHVAKGDDWISVADFPGAVMRDLDKGPGVVWQRGVSLQLPLGARLMCVESFPERAPRKDPLAYFWEETRRAARGVRRSFFRVESGGRLVRSTEPHR